MAIYHFTVHVMSRSEGRNAVAGAAYRHGVMMKDEQTKESFTKVTQQEVEHCEFSLPENAPKWAKGLLKGDIHKNSEKFWNAVERFEKRVDAQLYRDVEFALPHELTKEQRLELAREFIKDNFTSKGMIADWAVHNHFDEKDNIEKPHVHVMLTMRELKETNTSEKIKNAFGLSSLQINFGLKVRDWNANSLLVEWREKWAEYANQHLAKAGLEVRIDHRSYVEQGIDFLPQPKLGKAVAEIHERGLHVDRLSQMKDVQAYNLNLIRKNPDIVLDYISRYQSTFTRQTIAKVLDRYVHDPDEYMQHLARIEASPKLVSLTGTEKGQASLLTTQEMIKLESQICDLATTLAPTQSCSAPGEIIEKSIEKGRQKLKQFGGLSKDQENAIRHMTSDGQLKVIVGFAGAGKTTSLEVAHKIWQESGYRVSGAAPTGRAASNLADIGIPSKTFHKWEREWKNGREQLDENCVLILDEAGMVDTRKIHSLLTEAQEKNFKVVFVGDPEQLSPIEAGAPVRAVMERIGFAEISNIVRQTVDWQKEATKHLAMRNTNLALNTYDQKGHLYFGLDAKEELVKNWAIYCSENHNTGLSKSALILAFFNKDVQELNDLAREEARLAGRLKGEDHQFIITRQKNIETLDRSDEEWNAKSPCLETEKKDFAIGDQIVFLKNDYDLEVKNGQLGKIKEIQDKCLTVEKEDNSTIAFDAKTYSFFDHGYATTIHKSQGTTVDKTFLYASQYMNRHLTYVALSRHREDARLYADQEVFKNKGEFMRRLSQEASKDNVFDHQSQDEQKALIDQLEQRTFMQRRFISGLPTSYISWDSIKGFTYKIWSQARDWMFGDISSLTKHTHKETDLSIPKDSAQTLRKITLSENQLQIIQDTQKTYYFDAPENVSENHSHQLIAHTFSYLKSLHLDETNESKEKELLIKACYIQAHLKDIATGFEAEHWSVQKVFAITALASHLWYKGKDESSYAFEKDCLTKAINHYEDHQEQLPQLQVNYQKLFPSLTNSQTSSLADHTMKVFQFTHQLPTQEQLQETVKSLTQKCSSSQTHEPTGMGDKSKTIPYFMENNLTHSRLDPSFEKALGQLVHQHRQESQSQVSLQIQQQYHKVPELDR